MSTDQQVLVVGYDGHDHAAGTLRFAADFATRMGAQLQIVHVVDLEDYPVDPDSASWEEKAVEAVDEEREAARVTLQHWDGSWSYGVEHGDPVMALIRVATRTSAALIVVGASTGGFVRHFLSAHMSMTNELSRGDFPLLIVPTGWRSNVR